MTLHSEPKCVVQAGKHSNSVNGVAVLWRGTGSNPYPLKSNGRLSSKQMQLCETCELNKELYSDIANKR